MRMKDGHRKHSAPSSGIQSMGGTRTGKATDFPGDKREAVLHAKEEAQSETA